MNETQSVIVYRSKWEQEMDEYRGEIVLFFVGLVFLVVAVIKIQDWWQNRKARKRLEQLRVSVGLENKKRGW